MFAMPGLRGFSLAAKREAGRVSCNGQGVFVGHAPLLEQIDGSWRPRPTAELNHELTDCYRLPVDITAKANALALIAHALNRGDLAMAAIAAVQMQIPDPPSLAKWPEKRDDIARRARELAHSGLLKVWEPEEHPRTGKPPNPGWFAPVDGSKDQDIRVAVKPGPNNPWAEFPDAEGGGGGGPPSRSASQQPDLPFSGGQQRAPKAEEPSADQPAPAVAPRSWTPPDPGSKLPFMGETPPQLAPYEDGQPTWGILKAGDSTFELRSGYDGPALNMPDESSGFNGVTLGHVEGHAAALMRQMGINEATLEINNPDVCVSCEKNLPRMLPPGSTLHLVLPNGTRIDFHGNTP